MVYRVQGLKTNTPFILASQNVPPMWTLDTIVGYLSKCSIFSHRVSLFLVQQLTTTSLASFQQGDWGNLGTEKGELSSPFFNPVCIKRIKRKRNSFQVQTTFLIDRPHHLKWEEPFKLHFSTWFSTWFFCIYVGAATLLFPKMKNGRLLLQHIPKKQMGLLLLVLFLLLVLEQKSCKLFKFLTA